jgi:sporulation protein YlmC with PRC-barrel domain
MAWRYKMEIPLGAKVECKNGVFGHSEFLLINPVNEKVSNLVVKKDSSHGEEYVVPIKFLIKTTANTIQLRCSKAELEEMNPFCHTDYIEERVPDKDCGPGGVQGAGPLYYMPYVTCEKTIRVADEHEEIPAGEMAVRRGTRVEAKDGFVGRVDEFVVNPKNGHITHLVMRQGHLWGDKDILIPVSKMSGSNQDTVHLEMDKKEIESLPNVPVRRRWA